MMEDQGMPPAWQEKDHFALRVAWLSNEPPPGTRELEEKLRRELVERDKEDAEPLSLELAGHPGWWLYFNVEMSHHDALDKALTTAKTVLKHSDLSAGTFNLEVRPGTKAPVQLSKSQRRKLIDQIMNPPAHELSKGLVREAFWEVGDHALSLWVEVLRFREEFSAAFAAPDNPLRSLVGKECLLKTLSYDEDLAADEATGEAFDGEDRDEGLADDSDLDDFDDLDDINDIGEDIVEDIFEDIDANADADVAEGANDWEETARGVLAIEGTTLRIGDWSQEIAPDEPVGGVAYEWARLEAPGVGLYVEALDGEPPMAEES